MEVTAEQKEQFSSLFTQQVKDRVLDRLITFAAESDVDIQVILDNPNAFAAHISGSALCFNRDRYKYKE